MSLSVNSVSWTHGLDPDCKLRGFGKNVAHEAAAPKSAVRRPRAFLLISAAMKTATAQRQGGVFAHGRNRIAYDLLSECQIEQILDFGCGRGGVAVAAARGIAPTVHACDIDSALVEELDRRFGSEVNFFTVSDSTPSLPLSDGQLSAITCCDVLEHMPAGTRLLALREMHRVLADDGGLIITVPHKSLLAAPDPENVKVYFPRIHRLVYIMARGREAYESAYGGDQFGNFSAGAQKHEHFSRSDLTDLLQSTGFRVESVRYFGLIYPLIRTLLWAVEGLERRVRLLGPLKEWLWRIYRWDSDVEPGRVGCFIAIRAAKAPR